MAQAPERIGRYRIVAPLGRGAMGVVYRAEDTRIGRQVALKTVARPEAASSPLEHERFARFLREARAAGTLSHPNVVTVHDVGDDEDLGLSYIAMELIEGEPLDRHLRAGRSLTAREVCDIGIQVADALDAAHQAGVIHRDIKPSNLVLTDAGTVKVTDFGVAKLSDASMTQDGALLGSPSYMSPEQVRASDVDARSDLFSLGTVLYELATGKQAFPGKNIFEVVGRVVKGDVTDPAVLRPDLPGELRQLIRKAMATARDDRFPSAAAMAAALRGVRDSLAPPPAPPAPAPRTARVATPAARRLAWIGLGVLAVAATGLLLIPRSAREAPTRPPAEIPAPAPAESVSSGTTGTAPTAPTLLPFRASVEHRHDIGHCDGVLTIADDRIAYNQRDGSKDDRVWSYPELGKAEVSGDEIELTTGEEGKFGLGKKRYRFKLTRGRVPESVRRYLQSRVAS